MRANFIPGVEVTIRVANTALTEYEDGDNTGLELEAAKTAAAYIEAVPGANFKVELKLNASFPYTEDHLNCEVYADGTWVVGGVIDLTRPRPLGWAVFLEGSVENVDGGAVLRRFQFAEHQMSE